MWGQNLRSPGKILWETYLYNFEGDLYGKDMKVELLDFVRPEMKFESIDALKAQLDHDIKECQRRYLEFA